MFTPQASHPETFIFSYNCACYCLLQLFAGYKSLILIFPGLCHRILNVQKLVAAKENTSNLLWPCFDGFRLDRLNTVIHILISILHMNAAVNNAESG